MPGPPAPWSKLNPDSRSLVLGDIEQFVAKINVEDNKQNSSFELPQSALEDLGDNDQKSKPSAVLVPLIINEDKTIDSVVVMTRTVEVSHHKGQVSFPGGMVEKEDNNFRNTALRETHEEIGISPDKFTFIGELNPVTTKTRDSKILPVVATTQLGSLQDVSLNPHEVDTLHQISIAQLLVPDNYFCEIWDFGEMAVPIHMYFVKDHNLKDVFIWGATAHILTELLHCSTGE